MPTPTDFKVSAVIERPTLHPWPVVYGVVLATLVLWIVLLTFLPRFLA